MTWTVIPLDEVEDWLTEQDNATTQLVASALDLLEQEGPALGRPYADVLHNTTLHNLKELRPGSIGRRKIRILFAFDPQRQAILLVAGDKAGAWDRWYRRNIPIAERRYQAWLDGDYD